MERYLAGDHEDPLSRDVVLAPPTCCSSSCSCCCTLAIPELLAGHLYAEEAEAKARRGGLPVSPSRVMWRYGLGVLLANLLALPAVLFVWGRYDLDPVVFVVLFALGTLFQVWLRGGRAGPGASLVILLVAVVVFLLWIGVVFLEALSMGVEGLGPRAEWWAVASFFATLAFLAWRYRRFLEVV